MSRLLKSLFPLLPRASSPALRSYIRKTILSDIKVANSHSQNHKLNRAVQAMLFGMVERGMSGEVTGDKGKSRAAILNSGDPDGHNTDEGMWAIILTKELWRKRVWCVVSTFCQVVCSLKSGPTPSLSRSWRRGAFILQQKYRMLLCISFLEVKKWMMKMRNKRFASCCAWF